MVKQKAQKLAPGKRLGVGGKTVQKSQKAVRAGKKGGTGRTVAARRAAHKPNADKLRAKTMRLKDGQKVWRKRGNYQVEFIKRKGRMVETGNRKSLHTGKKYLVGQSGRGRRTGARVHRGVVRR